MSGDIARVTWSGETTVGEFVIAVARSGLTLGEALATQEIVGELPVEEKPAAVYTAVYTGCIGRRKKTPAM